jgi:sodium transport system permease protein
MPKFLIVLLKELRETLRDKRSVSILALFVFMYPALIGTMLNRAIDRASKPEREGVALTVIGAAQAPNLIAQLKQKNVLVTPHGPMSEAEIAELLRAKKAVAVLTLDPKFSASYNSMRPAHMQLWFDSGVDNGHKLDDVEKVLNSYTSQIAQARLLAHGVSPVVMMPVQVQRYDTGTAATRSAALIGAMVGSFFVPIFIFCLSLAIDTTAGERERRSLEVLLAQPVRGGSLLLGKIGAAATLSVIGFTLEMVVAHLMLKWMPLEEIGLSWRLSGLSLASVIAVSLPLCAFAAAFEVALAMNAKTFKEAQSTLSLAVILPLMPVIVVPMLDLQSGTWMYAVPVLGNITLFKELSKGAALGPLPYLLTAAVPAALALACYAFAALRLKSEKYVLSV